MASDTSADSVELEVDGKIVLRVNKIKQDNDSVKATAFIGGVPIQIESERGEE